MKDDFLNQLVNETFADNELDVNFIPITYSSRKLCYCIKSHGRSIEFPSNWGVFSQLSSSGFKEIILKDELLHSAISNFLDLNLDNIEIKKTSTGLVLCYTKKFISNSKIAA